MPSPEKTSLFVKWLREDGLTEEQIDIVLGAMADICPDCWDCEAPCHCENDD